MSGFDSDNDSQRSLSPTAHGSVPTPGYGLDRSKSNSPNFDDKNREIDKSPSTGGSQSRSASPAGSERSTSHSGSARSRSSSRASDRSGSRSGSATSNNADSHISNRSESPGSRHSRSRTRGSSRSASQASNRSGSNASRTSARSGSNVSNKSGSQKSKNSRSRKHALSRSESRASNRSGSHISRTARSHSHASGDSKRSGSNKAESPISSHSRVSNKSKSSPHRSVSRDSNKSGSGASNRSKSVSRSRSASEVSNRSGSPNSRKSRSSSRGSAKSRSNSRDSNRSKSGSSRSRSHSSSRSGSKASNRSRSSSAKSRSGSRVSVRSGSHVSNKSRSKSPLVNGEEHVDKRKRSVSVELPTTHKRSRIIDSDTENSEGDKEEPSAAALFGDADDISSEDDKDKNDEDARRESDVERDREHARERERLSDSDQEQAAIEDEEEKEPEPEPEPIPETRIDVDIPKISCDLGKDIHFVKLPNFLSVETRPFDQETYEDEIDEEETLDEEGRARLKLKVENTMRWREDIDKEGNAIKESNARLVRWSDGSFSLHLGSEIFDVYKQPLQGDHNHLFIRQGTGLQGQAVFRTKLSFRPHSTESFTHRKMTLSLADRSQKVSGIKILSQVGIDPDQDRKELLKEEKEKLRQTARVKPRKRESITRAHQREAYREEEGSDEDGVISLSAIKNKYKPGQQTRGGAIYSSDEEGSDFDARRSRLDKPKALIDSESSDDDEGESE